MTTGQSNLALDANNPYNPFGIKLTSQGKRVCAAVEGEVGSTCGCGIYEQRPDACRKFEAGSFLCKEARKAAQKAYAGNAQWRGGW